MSEVFGTIHFFKDARRPLDSVDTILQRDLTASIIPGIDLGLSSALVEFAEEKIAEHETMAVQAFHTGDEDLGEHHTLRACAWDEVRREARDAFVATARIRAN